MLDRLAEGFASGGGSSDTFQPPQNFSVADSSSTYLALIWQPDSAATGFNIYRSLASGGPYTKIGTVSGEGGLQFSRLLQGPQGNDPIGKAPEMTIRNMGGLARPFFR